MTHSGKQRLWPILILGFVGFVTSFGAHIVAVNLPAYAEQVGIGLAMIGLLISAYDLAEIVAKPIFGAIADKKGMKVTMLAGIALFTVSSIAFLFVSPKLLLLIRFLQGVGAAALSGVSLALVGVYFKENRGRAYGWYNMLKGAGYVISPLVGGALVAKSHFSSIFIVTAAIGATAFLLSLSLPKPAENPKLDDDDESSWKELLDAIRNMKLLPWYVVIVVNMFFVGILFGFVPVRLHDLHYSAFQSGIVMTIISASYILIQPLAGTLADRLNPLLTIGIGLALSGICVLLFPFVSGLLLYAVGILAGFGIGTVWTNTDALVSGLSEEGKLGMTMGVVGSFKEFGDMLGPLLLGILSQTFGLTTGFVTCGVLGLLSVFLLLTQKKNFTH